MDMDEPLTFRGTAKQKAAQRLAHMKNAAGKRNFLAGPLHSLSHFSCDAT
jgi:hypothetical protein